MSTEQTYACDKCEHKFASAQELMSHKVNAHT